MTATLPDEASGALEDPAPEDGARSSQKVGLDYNPALDGIRGLAVGAVLLFHSGFPWAQGGYLGVSTFFTLSGFLITSLLLGEQARTGRIGLTAFWSRRMRRLLPASAVTLGALLVSLVLVDDLWGPELPGDVVASALQVANWHFLWEDRSYGELFAAPSPALHIWSLAIEEQFYWLFPLLTAGVLGLAKGSRRVYSGVLVALLAGSAALTFVWRDAPDTVYYATPVRMGEILVGALLAVLVVSLKENDRIASVFLQRTIGGLGLAALAASAWAWWTVEQSSTSLSHGFLLLYALGSGALVLAVCVPGPVRSALAFEPLRLLGLVSYAVYLFHWPLFLVLTPQRIDDLVGWAPGGWALFAVRLVPTLALAAGSYLVLEQPIRKGSWPRVRWAPVLAFGSVAAVVAAALLVPDSVASPRQDQFEAAADQLAGNDAGADADDPADAEGGFDPEAVAAAEAEIEERREAVPQEAVDVMFFGDSAALTVAAGVGEWGLQTKRLMLVGDGYTTQVGCGIGRGGERRQLGTPQPVPAGCPQWDRDWGREIDERPDLEVGVLLTGSWDVMDRKIPGDDQWRGPGDPVYDRYLQAEIEGATSALLAKGLKVVWLTTPPLDFSRALVPRPEHPDPPDALERIDRLNELITGVVADHPSATVVDFGAHFAALSPAEDARLRPDGVHVDLANSLEVARWLAPEILASVAELDALEPVSGN
ncbi:MAG TPA: acyltransferase family protein [Acidimicrobiales bacterium]|nr:acyltransferase family protein [Acidimicrobiales bacterium]